MAKIIRTTAAVPLLMLLLAAPAAASGEFTEGSARKAAIVFVPGLPPKTKPPLIDRLSASGGTALGFASAIQGAYTPEQTLVDMSAGARIWNSLYDGDEPQYAHLIREGGGAVVSDWPQITERARTAPADIVPGLLGELFRDSVSYVGLENRRNREAIVASDRSGRVPRFVTTPRDRVGREAVRQWRASRLLVVRLPNGRAGSRGLEALREARRPGDVLLLMESPSAERRRLLAIGAAGLGSGRNLRSDTTRTDGLVSATDVAPTVMEHLGVDVPDEVAGRTMETRGDRSAEDLTELKDRLAEIGPRRWRAVLGGLLGAAFFAGIVTLGSGDRRRRIGRPVFLAALWLPSVLLVTGELAPTRVAELALIAGACALLALATDRLLTWPRAIALPATVTVVSHVIDLALGSQLIQRSLLGPNPILGARFYGVGNELEVTLGVIGLIGVGALLARAPRPRLVWGFVIGGSALALALSWGKLGADVGASIMIAAGTAAGAVAALGERPGRLRIALVAAAPLVALGALAVLDIATGGDAHFTRSVLDAGGLGELADIAQRRAAQMVELASLGSDDKLDLNVGDRVEFVDTAYTSRGEPLPLLRVEEVDLPGRRVRLSDEPDAGRRTAARTAPVPAPLGPPGGQPADAPGAGQRGGAAQARRAAGRGGWLAAAGGRRRGLLRGRRQLPHRRLLAGPGPYGHRHGGVADGCGAPAAAGVPAGHRRALRAAGLGRGRELRARSAAGLRSARGEHSGRGRGGAGRRGRRRRRRRRRAPRTTRRARRRAGRRPPRRPKPRSTREVRPDGHATDRDQAHRGAARRGPGGPRGPQLAHAQPQHQGPAGVR